MQHTTLPARNYTPLRLGRMFEFDRGLALFQTAAAGKRLTPIRR